MHTAVGYRCPNCGNFAIGKRTVAMAGEQLHDPRLHALVRERSLETGPIVLHLNESAPTVSGYVPMRIDAAERDFPTLVSERLDRALLNLGRLTKNLGNVVNLPWTAPAALFAITKDEAKFLAKALEAAGLVKLSTSTEGAHAGLTPDGWDRVAKLQSGRLRDPKSPAFVAMWFGKDGTDETPSFMQDLYANHVQTAIQATGYRCERVDLIPHNDFIMDKILGMIRRAPFVVADFTGNRGGVYFEAGFARGLKIPVIHTCRDTHFDDAHFDIKQINTICWNTPEQLAEGLCARISGTLGPGPFFKSDTSGDSAA
jgi:hypothetical protein